MRRLDAAFTCGGLTPLFSPVGRRSPTKPQSLVPCSSGALSPESCSRGGPPRFWTAAARRRFQSRRLDAALFSLFSSRPPVVPALCRRNPVAGAARPGFGLRRLDAAFNRGGSTPLSIAAARRRMMLFTFRFSLSTFLLLSTIQVQLREEGAAAIHAKGTQGGLYISAWLCEMAQEVL